MTNPYLPTAIRSIFTFSARQCVNQHSANKKMLDSVTEEGLAGDILPAEAPVISQLAYRPTSQPKP